MVPDRDFFEEESSDIRSITEVDLNDPNFIKVAENLGRMGIIFPHHIKVEDLCNTLYFYYIMTNDDGLFRKCQEVDLDLSKDEFFELAKKYLFLNLYEDFNQRYYKETRDRIETFLNNHYAPMGCFFSQCCNALENELLYPCICGLTTILEGILGKYTGLSKTSMHVLFEKIKSQLNDGASYIIAINIQSFIDAITSKSDFSNQNEPVQLNRHWLLHGRSNRDITKLDCISIICAVDAIIEIIQSISGDTP